MSGGDWLDGPMTSDEFARINAHVRRDRKHPMHDSVNAEMARLVREELRAKGINPDAPADGGNGIPGVMPVTGSDSLMRRT